MLDRLATALADRYRVERELGQGGMATVYLAEDLKHRRKVAIKVLHPELSAVIGGERFLKEIELTASLQHPHVLPLFDSGAADGLLYYVMPYVEGESLRGRLARERQLPLEDAVRIAREVAGALDYAHKRGVVHRDIKPENVLLQEGSALVADFGIALAVSNAGAGRLTQTGLSLGTPHYMSPEQAMGEREITPRADVYALGAMTYEMLVGEPPFTGPSAQAVVAKVLTEKPVPASVHRDTVPANASAALQKALAKLPADRFASTAEFAAALVAPGFGQGSTFATVPMASAAPGSRAPARAARLALLAAAVLLPLAALTAWALLRRAPSARVERYAMSFLPGQEPADEAPFTLSPDGSALAYVGPAPSGRQQLWVKRRDSWAATPVPGTEDVSSFTFSPDGRWLAFVALFQLRKIPVIGGAALTLADSVTTAPGLAWLEDGSIVFARTRAAGAGTWTVPAEGGTLRRIRAQEPDEDVGLFTPLPGSRAVLHTRCTGSCNTFDLVALDVRDGSSRVVQPGGIVGFYVPTGHVAYVRPDGALLAVPFDLATLQARGTPVPLHEGISVLDGVMPLISVAADGTLLFRRGAMASLFGQWGLHWFGRDGSTTPVDTAFAFSHTFYGGNAGWSLSPDGRRVAIGRNTESGDDIWVKELPRGPVQRVTFDSGGSSFRPRWHPDGRTVLFGSNREGRGLYRRAADGTGADELALKGDIYEATMSRDGRWLVVRVGGRVGATGGRDISALRIGVDTAPVPLLATPFDESEAALSPDGRWLAYVSDETGRPELFLRPFPEVGRAKYQVSGSGAQSPVWSRDGRELFYLSGAREMMAVTVQGAAEPRLGERRVLFQLDRDTYPTAREFYTPFDVAPDGRFLMARRARSGGERLPLLVTRNWFTELRAQLGRER